MYIHVCISFMYLCIYIYIYTFICFIYLFMYIYIYTHLLISFIYSYIYIYMYIIVYLLIYLYMRVPPEVEAGAPPERDAEDASMCCDSFVILRLFCFDLLFDFLFRFFVLTLRCFDYFRFVRFVIMFVLS